MAVTSAGVVVTVAVTVAAAVATYWVRQQFRANRLRKALVTELEDDIDTSPQKRRESLSDVVYQQNATNLGLLTGEEIEHVVRHYKQRAALRAAVTDAVREPNESVDPELYERVRRSKTAARKTLETKVWPSRYLPWGSVDVGVDAQEPTENDHDRRGGLAERDGSAGTGRAEK